MTEEQVTLAALDDAPRISLTQYIMDLELLVRWLANTFGYMDPETGELTFNRPIWTAFNQYGQENPDVPRLERTWMAVVEGE